MNNEMNDNNNKEIINNEKCFFKINIIKQKDNEKNDELQNNKIEKNKLFFSPKLMRRKSKSDNDNDIKSILERSFREKKKIVVEPENNKKQSLNTKNMKEKEIIFSNSNKEKDNNLRLDLSPKRKKPENNIIKNNNGDDNINDISNIFNFTNKLYENDEHLSKILINKKIEINEPLNNRKKDLFNIKKINQKNKLINLGLNEFNNFTQKIQEANNRLNNSFKKKINNCTKTKTIDMYKDKLIKKNFNSLNNNKQIISPKKNKELSSNNNNNYLNKYGENTPKSNRFFINTAKTLKNNTNKIYENSLNDKEKQKANQIKRVKTSITNNNEKINSIDNKINNVLGILNKNNTENKDKLNKKKIFFCFLCCLNSNPKDSDSF